MAVLLGLAALGGGYFWARYHFRAALTGFDNDLFSEARDHIRLCLKAWPEDPEAHFLAARIAREMSDFMAAEQHLKAYKRVRGITDELQTEWVLVRAQAGEFPLLEANLWDCVKENHPQSLEILRTLTLCCMKEMRYGKADAYLGEWLKRAPNSALALEWRGLVRESIDSRLQAVEDYRKALEIAPGRWHARLQLAQVLIGLTRFQEAERHLEQLRGTSPHQEEVLFSLAQCLLNQGKNEEARQIFLELPETYLRRSQVLCFLGKLEPEPAEAEKWYRKSLQADSMNMEARFALYQSLCQQTGREQEAAQELATFGKAKKGGEQMKRLMERMDREPRNPDLLTQIGGQLLERFNNPQGLTLVFRALYFDPNQRQAHEILARYYEKHGQEQQAAKHRAMLQEIPNSR